MVPTDLKILPIFNECAENFTPLYFLTLGHYSTARRYGRKGQALDACPFSKLAVSLLSGMTHDALEHRDVTKIDRMFEWLIRLMTKLAFMIR
jgi:hypothetical protein